MNENTLGEQTFEVSDATYLAPLSFSLTPVCERTAQVRL